MAHKALYGGGFSCQFPMVFLDPGDIYGARFCFNGRRVKCLRKKKAGVTVFPPLWTPFLVVAKILMAATCDPDNGRTKGRCVFKDPLMTVLTLPLQCPEQGLAAAIK